MADTRCALDLADRLELHELPARYGDLVDARDWAGLESVFTETAVFEIVAKDVLVLRGLAAIREHMDGTDAHPLAHLMVNVQVDDGDPVLLDSRVLGICRAGWSAQVATWTRWRARPRDGGSPTAGSRCCGCRGPERDPPAASCATQTSDVSVPAPPRRGRGALGPAGHDPVEGVAEPM